MKKEKMESILLDEEESKFCIECAKVLNIAPSDFATYAILTSILQASKVSELKVNKKKIDSLQKKLNGMNIRPTEVQEKKLAKIDKKFFGGKSVK